MEKATYQLYVKTDCFKIRRDAYIRNRQWCEGCGDGKANQVHHLSYERLGRELDQDLLAVCDRCHRAFHDMPGAYPKAWIIQRWEANPDSAKKQIILQQLRITTERSIW